LYTATIFEVESWTAGVQPGRRRAHPNAIARGPVRLRAIVNAERTPGAAVTTGPGTLAARRAPVHLLSLQRRLHSTASISELFGHACEIARMECGFSRALIASVEGGRLRADAVPALTDPASDRLRRMLLAEPLRLQPGSAEAEFVRLAEGGRGELVEGESILRRRLGLQEVALGAIMPEDRVLALLVAERSVPIVEATDRATVQSFAQMVSWAVERHVMRRRMDEIAGEVRYMMTSARALIDEGINSPLILPSDNGAGPVFTKVGDLVPSTPTEFRELFTRREWSIASQIASGKSNREIALTLHISPETVKTYVSRVLRKLGAATRAEAAARFVHLSGPAI
jgi:DNA-binding CsgD family transcriptional regulator